MTAKYLSQIAVGVYFLLVATTVVRAADSGTEDSASATDTQIAEESAEQAPSNDAEIGEESSGSAGEDSDQDISPRIRAHDRFLFLYDGERYAEASVVGVEVVELTRQEFGASHINVAAPLVNLAIAQTKSGDLPSAEVNYQESIEIIEDAEGVLSPRLINPLSGLGSAYNKAGLYEKGSVALERALLINHVNEGLYNFEQFKIHDGLTDSFVGMNAMEDATFYQKAQVEIHERKLGVDHPEVATALYKLAEWYELINDIEQAMLTYRRADRLLRKIGGDYNVARVGALQGIAEVYERQGLPSSTASTLKKALAIIDEQSEPDYLQSAKILVALGDVYARQGKFESSELNYAAAWENLSLDDDYLEQRDFYFSTPVRILGGRFSTIEYGSRSKPESSLKNGYVLVSYSVTENGRTNDINVIESDPAGLMDRSILATYKRSIYRPRRVDGAAIATVDKVARHEFRYAETPKKTERASTDDPPKKSSDDERLEYPDQGD